MSHSDTISNLPTKGVLLASTSDVKNALTKLMEKLLMQFSFIQKYTTQQMEKNY